MRKTIYFPLCLYLIFSCTKYDDDIQFDVQDYKTLTPENIQTNLKVANLILSQDDFNEMYANYTEDIEIEGLFSLYKDGAVLIQSEVVQVEIKGQASAANELKSLGIMFNDNFNNEDRKLINSETFSFHSLDQIKAFKFRNSGNDFFETMIKDLSYTKLAINAGLNLDLTYGEQTVVFVNNDFLGVMNLRTEANAYGVSRLYGVSENEITLAKINIPGIIVKKNGDFARIDNFISAIEVGDYNYLKEEIDIDNFIDYMIFESYIANRDWPMNNVRFFAVNQGPFRFVLYDLDLATTYYIDDSPMSFIQNHPTQNPITDLFNIMYSQLEFKEMYDMRFETLMNSGSLGSSAFNTIVNEYKENIEHVMPFQIEKYNTPGSFTEWYLNIEHLKNNFESRENYVW